MSSTPKLMKDYADVIDADAHDTAPAAKRAVLRTHLRQSHCLEAHRPLLQLPLLPLDPRPPPLPGLTSQPPLGQAHLEEPPRLRLPRQRVHRRGGEAAEEAAEPSLQLEAAAGVDILLKEKVHLATPAPPDADKKWIPRGMGLLTIRRAAADDGSNRHYMVFTTESGRVLLNGLIAKQLPAPTLRGKTGNQVVMVLMSNVDGKVENGLKVFRADTADVAKRIVDKVVEVQNQA